jgi:hypothetical protein
MTIFLRLPWALDFPASRSSANTATARPASADTSWTPTARASKTLFPPASSTDVTSPGSLPTSSAPTIELAQNLVLGAVDYAQTLGFDPHRDFYLAKPHLGDWQPPSKIRFGLNGKPYFQQGPYDNPTRVMRTLDRTVGPGNYHFSTVISADSHA